MEFLTAMLPSGLAMLAAIAAASSSASPQMVVAAIVAVLTVDEIACVNAPRLMPTPTVQPLSCGCALALMTRSPSIEVNSAMPSTDACARQPADASWPVLVAFFGYG